MRHPLLVRAFLGGAGMAGCIAILAGTAKAADQASAIPSGLVMPAAQVAPIAPNLFGTVALPIRADRFDDQWERARRDASRTPQMQQLVAPARGLSAERQLAFVQMAVDHRIRWMSDATLWGRHDYWASAAETLSAGAGDDKNRAIVKMQALRALGFSTRDLYLTLGRDVVGGPEAVLVARVGNRAYVLEDNGAPPYLAGTRREFTPALSFGYGGSWVHARIRPAPNRSSIATATSAATALHGAAQ